MSGFYRRGVHKERSRGGVGGSSFVVPFWCGVLGHTAGLSSGLLLLMCVTRAVTGKIHRLGIGNFTDYRLCMANGEYTVNMFLSFLSIDLDAAMLAPSYS